jgi:hypothetical protein
MSDGTSSLPPQVPGAFLPSDQKVNLSRLMELLGFALSHFTVGPDARRLNELIQAAAGGGAAAAGSQARLQQNMLLEKVSKAAVLAPVIGILLGLAPRQQEQPGQEQGQGGGRQEGLLVAQLVASTDARMPEYLQFVKVRCLQCPLAHPGVHHELMTGARMWKGGTA